MQTITRLSTIRRWKRNFAAAFYQALGRESVHCGARSSARIARPLRRWRATRAFRIRGRGLADMHIFLDESGTFVGYQKGSIGVVGALVIPDGNLQRLR
jgi:hypothetical protein